MLGANYPLFGHSNTQTEGANGPTPSVGERQGTRDQNETRVDANMQTQARPSPLLLPDRSTMSLLASPEPRKKTYRAPVNTRRPRRCTRKRPTREYRSIRAFRSQPQQVVSSSHSIGRDCSARLPFFNHWRHGPPQSTAGVRDLTHKMKAAMARLSNNALYFTHRDMQAVSIVMT